jgi:hypothetical protein
MSEGGLKINNLIGVTIYLTHPPVTFRDVPTFPLPYPGRVEAELRRSEKRKGRKVFRKGRRGKPSLR